ncbi:MAG: hypothetical protein JST19_01375 [Bacteroidetes bacterium]|nr:hypothetical protein [Bacteroidota bacterium]
MGIKIARVKLKPVGRLSRASVLIWRTVQLVTWLAGVAILFSLTFYPSIGLLAFWNVLIPAAPVLLVVFTGLWRNICPLATTTLLPRHLGLSGRKTVSQKKSGVFNFVAVIVLFVVVPLRHAIFNTNGLATAILIIGLTACGVAVGFVYEWKSAWCSGLCPIHPVEKLYGGNVIASVPNLHCDLCCNCVAPCPDSTHNIDPAHVTKSHPHRRSGPFFTGCLPGFIWGWFHVPDQRQIHSLYELVKVYEMPFLGMAVTFALYLILQKIVNHKYETYLTSFFAASAVSCYYWYRLPELFGFGHYSKDGLLVNLKDIVPAPAISSFAVAAVLFFFYWMLFREKNRKSWLVRPAFAKKSELKRQRTIV